MTADGQRTGITLQLAGLKRVRGLLTRRALSQRDVERVAPRPTFNDYVLN